MKGRVERIWITEIASDRTHLVGHTKGYVQVLVVATETMLGTSAIAKITSMGRWSVFGEVMETINPLNVNPSSRKEMSSKGKCSPCSDPSECECTRVPEACSTCGPGSCEGQTTLQESAASKNSRFPEDLSSRNLVGWLLKKRKNVPKRVEGEMHRGPKKRKNAPEEVWLSGELSIRLL